MRRFTYRPWGGGSRTVEADSIEFGPAHVIFKNDDGGIVLAERVEQVNFLREEESE